MEDTMAKKFQAAKVVAQLVNGNDIIQQWEYDRLMKEWRRDMKLAKAEGRLRYLAEQEAKRQEIEAKKVAAEAKRIAESPFRVLANFQVRKSL